jgi:hypothetical protein
MKKLESFRDNKSGSIRVTGDHFEIVVKPDGRIRTIGAVEIEPPEEVLAGDVYVANPDIKSPRSGPNRRRGSR